MRVPARVRAQPYLYSAAVTAVLFVVLAFASGAYRSRRGMIALSIGFVAAMAIGAGLRRLGGVLEPAISPVSVARHDARGQRVAARDLRLKELALSDAETLLLALHVHGHTPFLNRRWVVLATLALSVAAWLWWLRIGPPLVGHDAAFWGGLAVLVLLGFLLSRLRRRASLAVFSDGLLVAGRCAACGYDLKYLPGDRDGCTVCAECGAAWRIGAWKDGDESESESESTDQ